MGSNTAPQFKIALVSMPWPLFNRPSIQLGILKSYLERETDYQVDNYHFYLHLAKTFTTGIYNRISLSGWAGEALFAPLLFPEKRNDARKLFYESLTDKTPPIPDFDKLVEQIEQSCSQWLTRIQSNKYNLIGFSLCFSQLLSSLYLARKIKKAAVDELRSSDKPFSVVPIAFGGSSCSGDIGKSLLHHFPEIDYLVDGEGEQQLFHLCRFLSGRSEIFPEKIRTLHPVPDARSRSGSLNLNDLPYPDYSQYFEEMHKLFPDQPFIPLLPIEFSRGCWWNKCAFCNLNLQWQDYRFKNSERMLKETLHLAQKHECLNFTFTDNALPSKDADRFFESILEKEMDFDFFAEIRSITNPEKLRRYRKAGLSTVQVGIEALSTSLLSKMSKGTKVIDNIAVMKMCSASAIKMEGNLITDFPGTTEEEIAETLNNLDYVLPFLPLQAATFFLGYGSPMYFYATDFSIQQVRPHAKNRKLFPQNYLQSMTMLINSHKGDKKRQEKLWHPVKQKIRVWQNFHQNREKTMQHPLQYRDGGTFLIIRQERISNAPLLHRLRGLSREIYLFCERPAKLSILLASFPRVNESALQKFIDEMCLKRLMFQEKDQVLSLAVQDLKN